MNRTRHLLVGLVLLALCAAWCLVFFVCFIGNAISQDSVPGASVHDSSFLLIYLVGGIGLLAGLRLALRSFGRALRSPRLDSPPQAATAPAVPEPQSDTKTPNDRLAHLVK